MATAMSLSAYKAVSKCAMDENNSALASVATQANAKQVTQSSMTFFLLKTEEILSKQLIAVDKLPVKLQCDNFLDHKLRIYFEMCLTCTLDKRKCWMRWSMGIQTEPALSGYIFYQPGESIARWGEQVVFQKLSDRIPRMYGGAAHQFSLEFLTYGVWSWLKWLKSKVFLRFKFVFKPVFLKLFWLHLFLRMYQPVIKYLNFSLQKLDGRPSTQN